MASGVGVSTKHGRCFPFYLRMIECAQDSLVPKAACSDQIEDYLECLHGEKEKARLKRIIEEVKLQKQQQAVQ